MLPRTAMGAMPKINLTARTVKAIRPPASGRIEYWDQGLPGLWLRVSDRGRKSWGITYRHNGRQRRLTIGKFPNLTLADARDKARVLLRQVGFGQDPAEEKRQIAMGATFGEMAARYLREHAIPNKKSWREDRRALDRDLLPRFGTRKAADIKRGEIVAILQSIKDRGAPILANRTLEIVRRMYNWGRTREIVEFNPCAGIEKLSKELQRDRVLSNDEIKSLWHALADEPVHIAGRYQLLLLTAQRGGEVRHMRWQDIDLADGWWTIPKEFSKNGLSHRVPLTGPVRDILEDLLGEARDDIWVFPSPAVPGPIRSDTKANRRLRLRSGVDFRPHDLRRTAASKMAGELGIDRLTLAKILNHLDGTVTAIYDRHSYDAEKRNALDAWAKRLTKILRARAPAIAASDDFARA